MGINFAASIKPPGSISIASRPDYNFGDQDFTIMALVKTNSPGTVLSKGNKTSKKGYFLEILPNALLELTMFGQNGSQYQTLSQATSLFDNRWHHITIIRNKATINIRVDGINILVGPNSIYGQTFVALDTDNNEPLLVGATGYEGDIANVALWNKALSGAEIMSAINNGVTANETIGYWQMNNNTADSSPGGNNGVTDGDISFISPVIDLPYNSQPQQQYCWCWAAVATSISLFYDPNSQWKQCLLANEAFNQTKSCEDGSSADCNKPWRLDQALALTGNFQRCTLDAADFETLKQELNNWRMVGAHITLQGMGGHFVAITGIMADQGKQYLTIEDPWWGVSQVPYEVFKSQYQSIGTWDASYFTTPCEGGSSNAG